MIYFSSDLHLFHNKEFCYKARGFNSVEEMNAAIIQRQNEIVQDDDEYYILGDVYLSCDDITVQPVLRQLKGKITVIRGNHDSQKKLALYRSLGWNVVDGLYFKSKKWMFYLCHYPVNVHNDSKDRVYCLCGHKHTKDKFEDFLTFGAYHVEVDAHNCYPVSIDQVKHDIYEIEKIQNF